MSDKQPKISSLQDYLTKLRDIVGQSKELEGIADDIEALDYSLDLPSAKDTDLYWNYTALGEYVGWFSFDWREEAYGPDEDEFVAKGIADIKQMLADIDAHNLYHPVFRVKTIYTDKDWAGKEVWQDIDAKTVEEAKRQTDDIRAKSPKTLADKPDLTLSDVILNMEIVDSSGEHRYKSNIEPEYGAYFNGGR